MAPEKSSFAQTCNLLSHYLKGRGASLGDISLIGHGPSMAPTTMDLLQIIESSNNETRQDVNIDPVGLLPQLAGFGSTSNEQEVKSNIKVAQMTIFYGGKVLVFDDFPADKASEIMALASKGSSTDAPNGSSPMAFAKQPTTPASGSDLPIASRASLRRFFDKRRDRIASKVPYQLNKPSAPISINKSEEKNPWLDLESQTSKHLELKL